MKITKTKITLIAINLTTLYFHRSKSAETSANESVLGHDYRYNKQGDHEENINARIRKPMARTTLNNLKRIF